MGRLVSRLVFDHLISWFDREATISWSRPNFGWPLRSGGKPVLRTGFCDDTGGARHQAQLRAANLYSVDP